MLLSCIFLCALCGCRLALWRDDTTKRKRMQSRLLWRVPPDWLAAVSNQVGDSVGGRVRSCVLLYTNTLHMPSICPCGSSRKAASQRHTCTCSHTLHTGACPPAHFVPYLCPPSALGLSKAALEHEPPLAFMVGTVLAYVCAPAATHAGEGILCACVCFCLKTAGTVFLQAPSLHCFGLPDMSSGQL